MTELQRKINKVVGILVRADELNGNNLELYLIQDELQEFITPIAIHSNMENWIIKEFIKNEKELVSKECADDSKLITKMHEELDNLKKSALSCL